MKTKKRKASPSVLIVLIVAILLIVSVTFAAIFRQTLNVTRTFNVSNFSAQTVAKFVDENGSLLSDTRMAQYKTEYGVRASVDPLAENYIGKLRASVLYKGSGVGLIRVRLTEEWSVPIYTITTVQEQVEGETVERQVKTKTGRTVQPYQLDIPYVVSNAYTGSSGNNQSKWYDNRKNDYCYYYATPVYSTGMSKIDLIAGVDTSGIDLGVLPISTEVQILFETDAVQVNRYPQYWSLDRLPWTATSANVHAGVQPEDETELPTFTTTTTTTTTTTQPSGGD